MDIEFTRKAVRRFVFDKKNAIPLSSVIPSEILKLNIEYPDMPISGAATSYCIKEGKLAISADSSSTCAMWAGGFNPFATYDIDIAACSGEKVKVGAQFALPDHSKRMVVLAGFKNGSCYELEFLIEVDGKMLCAKTVLLAEEIMGSFTLRIQLMATGLNIYTVQQNTNQVIFTSDFSELIDLRRKEYIRSFEFHILTSFENAGCVTLTEAGSYLTTGAGQADICAITYKEGAPFLDRGRLWFLMTIRGRHISHPTQGVFSMDPSVFDIHLEGVIVFDRGDGLLRNEIASHIFYDPEHEEWRGITVGFSAGGDADKKIPKQMWAVSSKKDPRFGFSVMQVKPVVIPQGEEDPYLIYDKECNKWRLLYCAEGIDFPAAIAEADHWDGPYLKIAGPIGLNSTGCMLQKIGEKYYALFGSSDRVFYVYSYPELKQLGTLDMKRPPWDDVINTRCWPNVIPLPDGYPAPYIALSMDRVNYPGLDGWTYGALYLYHGYLKEGERDEYEF